MASSIIHIAVAKKINDRLNYDEKNLLLGSIAPDVAKLIGNNKYTTHFFSKDDTTEIPNMEAFINKYKDNLKDPFTMGYFIHLYTDYFWFKDFMAEVSIDNYLHLLDGDIIIETPENYIKNVYSDYYSINRNILDMYEIDLSLFYEPFEIRNKYIKEVDNNDLYKIINKTGVDFKNSKLNDYKVFNLDNVSKFIETVSELIYSKIKDLLNEKNILISTSILNINNDINKIRKIDDTSTDLIHLDIMDGFFVKNICEYDKKLNLEKKVEIHLMVNDVKSYVQKYKDYHPEFFTFHYENNKENIWNLINYISKYSKVGIAINPKTNVEVLIPYLDYIDLVLIMSVEAGRGGQSFIDISDKIKLLNNLRKEKKHSFQIEVDGGINDNTVKKCKQADIIVVGSYITNASNYESQLKKIKNNIKN